MSSKQRIEKIYPLSPMQMGMLYHALNEERSEVYFEQTVLTLKGDIEEALLQESFNVLFKRHDVLRTIFRVDRAKEPIQVVLRNRNFKLHVEDITHLGKGEQEILVDTFARKDRARGFDLSRDILMRVALFKTGPGFFRLVWSFHHILMDGWCLGIIYEELTQIYRSLKSGSPVHLEAVTPYEAYIKWLARQDKEEGLAYWKSELEGYGKTAALPGYTVGKPCARVEEYTFLVEEKESLGLNRIAGTNQVTISIVFQALWGILLQAYTDSDDVVFGTVVSGRPPEIETIERMVGLFINTVPVRVTVCGAESFLQLLKRMGKISAASRSYEYLSLAEIQSVTPLKGNLIHHIMAFENYPLDEELRDIGLEADMGQGSQQPVFNVIEVELYEQTNYDFNISFIPVRKGTCFMVKFGFNPRVYGNDFITSAGLHLMEVIKQVVDDPGIAVKDIDIMTNEEKRQILDEFNQTRYDFPADKRLDELFAQQVEITPDYTAVYADITEAAPGGGHITYRQLQEKSRGLALELRKRGAGPDVIAGLMVKPSLEMVIGILAILKAGGAYLPVDPGYPEERKTYMLRDSNAGILLTGKDIARDIALPCPGAGSRYFLPGRPGSLAYVIYTSGTTGRPKGVGVEHRGVVNMLCYRKTVYAMNSEVISLQLFSYGFDGFVTGFFTPIISGARVVFPGGGESGDMEAIREALVKNRVTHFISVPSLYAVMLETLTASELSTLKVITLAGEKTTLEIIGRTCRKSDNIEIANEYGVTEASVMSTIYRHQERDRTIKIGHPTGNTQISILNKLNRQQPMGVPGELCISGTGLSRGYINNPALTRKKFLIINNQKLLRGVQGGPNRSPLPGAFLEKSPPGRRRQKLYKTGDRARWLPDGNIEFLGRVDTQVKIRGFRIELQEIENRLSEHEQVKAAVVVEREREPGDNYLCAYVVLANNDNPIDMQGLKDFLSGRLPAYMIPAFFIEMDSIPLNRSGKIDRSALPGIRVEPGAHGMYTAPGNRTEEKLVAIWSDVLGIDREKLGADANFFQLGGHSLKAVVMVSRIYKELHVKLPLAEVFKRPVIRGLSEYIRGAIPHQYIPIEPVEDREFYDVSYNQERLWIIRQVEQESTSYNLSIVVELNGDVQEKVLEQVFSKILQRHESIRTSFRQVDEKVVQVVAREKAIKIPLKTIDISNISGSGSAEKTRQRVRVYEEAGSISFDLGQAPLLRAILLKVNPLEYELIFSMHHIISDGWSMEILRKEFFLLYEAYGKGEGVKLEPVQFQYRDFSLWQREQLKNSQLKEKSHRYWLKKISGGIAPLHLPVDIIEENYGRQGAACGFLLSHDIKTRLEQVARDTGASLFMTIFTGGNMLLSWLSGQEQVVCGLLSAGREHAALEQIAGFFVNTLIVRNRIDYDESFKSLLAGVEQEMMETLQHQDYPLELVLDDLKMRFPEISVMFNMLHISSAIPGDNREPMAIRHSDNQGQVKFDLSFQVMEFHDGLEIRCIYREGLFKKERMEYMMQQYFSLLEKIAANPGNKIGEYFSLQKKRRLHLKSI